MKKFYSPEDDSTEDEEEINGGKRTLMNGEEAVEDLSNFVEDLNLARSVCLEDFSLIRVIGRGSFGKVVLVKKKDNSKIFAMKILSKSHIIKRKQVEHTQTERKVLSACKHPFITSLHYAFQTREKLYFVLDYCSGGELFYHLSRFGKFNESMTRFYASELIVALEHLHSLGVIYRDLKPENILLDELGHIKLADFGLAKDNVTESTQGANSLCGTPEYLAPEILNQQGHGTAVDWWGFGMIIYEMLCGLPPWFSENRENLFKNIQKAPLTFPPSLSKEVKDLLTRLLDRNPKTRLGARGAQEVKDHVFFKDVDFNSLLWTTPPFQPSSFEAKSKGDFSNFDREFTDAPVQNTPASLTNSQAARYMFSGFTYEAPLVEDCDYSNSHNSLSTTGFL